MSYSATGFSGTATLPLDAAGRLVEELPCLTCGYLLRGRRLDESCPECGSDVSASAHDDLLRYASRPWLGKLHRGAGWIIRSAILSVLVIALAITAGALGAPDSARGLMLLAIFVLGAMWLSGMWRMAVDEPYVTAPFGVATARLGVRLFVGVHALVILFSAASLVTGDVRMHSLMGVAGQVTGIGGIVMLLALLAQMARRIPSRGLAMWSRRLAWALVVATLLAVALSLGDVIAAVRPAPAQAGASWSIRYDQGRIVLRVNPGARITGVTTTTQPNGDKHDVTRYSDGTQITRIEHPDGRRTTELLSGSLHAYHRQWPDGREEVDSIMPGLGLGTRLSVAPTGAVSMTTFAAPSSVPPVRRTVTQWLKLMASFASGAVQTAAVLAFLVVVFRWRKALRHALDAPGPTNPALPIDAAAGRS